MKIRRYYGHDCDSSMGFNNGYYIDDEPIEVTDHAEAFRLCREVLAERYNLDGAELEQNEDGYELVTGYSDDDGNELTRDAWIEANESTEVGGYRYVFVNYYVVEDGNSNE